MPRLCAVPVELGECCEPLEAERGPVGPGGLPPALRGDPGGRLSVTDIRAAMGDGPFAGCCGTGPDTGPLGPPGGPPWGPPGGA